MLIFSVLYIFINNNNNNQWLHVKILYLKKYIYIYKLLEHVIFTYIYLFICFFLPPSNK